MRNILLFITMLFCCSFGYQKDKEPAYKGKVKTLTETNRYNRRKTGIVIRKYDEKGRMIEKLNKTLKRTRKGIVDQHPHLTQYEYNVSGQVTKFTEKYLASSYGSYEETEYLYDEKGNQTEAKRYGIFSTGAPRHIRSTEWKRYNGKGQLIEMRYAGPDKKIGYDSTDITIYKYEYPDDSTRVESYYNEQKDEYIKMSKDVFDKDGNIVKHVAYEKGEGKYRHTFQYNEDGNILKSTYEGEHEMHTTTYAYEDPDEKGNHRKMTRTLFEGAYDRGRSTTTLYSYEYYE